MKMKRMLSVLIAIAMVIGMVPAFVLADESEGESRETEAAVTEPEEKETTKADKPQPKCFEYGDVVFRKKKLFADLRHYVAIRATRRCSPIERFPVFIHLFVRGIIVKKTDSVICQVNRHRIP